MIYKIKFLTTLVIVLNLIVLSKCQRPLTANVSIQQTTTTKPYANAVSRGGGNGVQLPNRADNPKSNSSMHSIYYTLKNTNNIQNNFNGSSSAMSKLASMHGRGRKDASFNKIRANLSDYKINRQGDEPHLSPPKNSFTILKEKKQNQAVSFFHFRYFFM